MKNIDKDLNELIKDIDSILSEYDLGNYSIESMDLNPMAMPIDDEFKDSNTKKDSKEKPKRYEVKKLSEERLKIKLK